MSDEIQNARPLRTLREQEVQIALEALVHKHGGKVPSLAEVQKELKRRKYKHLSVARISEIISSLELKGYVRYVVEVLA